MQKAEVLQHLLDIREANGGVLDKEAVVTAATPKTHPLHASFEWDNRVAGHQYRLSQAGELIRSVKIDVLTADQGVSKVRALMSIQRPGMTKPVYEPTEQIASDPFLSKLLLQTAEREWRTLFAKYKHLTDFVELVQRDIQAS